MNRNEWITQAARLQSRGQAFALVTVLSAQAPTSGKPGDKAVVTADGQIHGWIGGGCAQPAVIKTVRRALLDGLARKIRTCWNLAWPAIRVARWSCSSTRSCQPPP
jgi:xanthine dehydrogenase accessory factor